MSLSAEALGAAVRGQLGLQDPIEGSVRRSGPAGFVGKVMELRPELRTALHPWRTGASRGPALSLLLVQALLLTILFVLVWVLAPNRRPQPTPQLQRGAEPTGPSPAPNQATP